MGSASANIAPSGRGQVTALVLLLVLAGIVCFRAPQHASNLDITPDAVEYAVAANRFVELGSYSIDVAGRVMPPRYPPFFSVVILAPWLKLLGSDPGNAIIPVTLFALVAVVAAYRVGRSVGGCNEGGLAAAVGVLLLPSFRYWSRQVMTDIPFTALILWSAYAFMTLRRRQGRAPLLFLAGGILTACAYALRQEGLALIVPWLAASVGLRPRRACVWRMALTALPVIAVMLGTWAYNATVFGNPFRAGYHFWCPVPCDYPSLYLSTAHIVPNLVAFALMGGGAPAFLGLSAAGLMLWRLRYRHRAEGLDRGAGTMLIVYAILGVGPIVVFHLGYAFAQGRFYIPASSLAMALSGGVLGGLLFRRGPGPMLLRGGVGALIAAAVAAQVVFPPERPWNREAADRIDRLLPKDALLVTTGQLVYLEPYVVRGTDRELMALSRRLEYAGKITARERVDDPQPPPAFYGDHLCAGILAGGGEHAVSVTAQADLDGLATIVQSGRPVYLDLSQVDARGDRPVLRRLAGRFEVTPVAPSLFRLSAQP